MNISAGQLGIKYLIRSASSMDICMNHAGRIPKQVIHTFSVCPFSRDLAPSLTGDHSLRSVLLSPVLVLLSLAALLRGMACVVHVHFGDSSIGMKKSRRA